MTSEYDDPSIVETAERAGIKIIPKLLASEVKILRAPPKAFNNPFVLNA